MLRLSSIALLLPLTEVYSVESVLDLDPQRKSGGSVGAVNSAGEWFPVFCLSDNLEPVTTLPETFRVCAILGIGDVALALAGRSLSAVDNTTLKSQPLPDCMRTSRSPVRALAHDGQKIFCHTSLTNLLPILEDTA
jgi:hypothetical protein